MSRYSGVIVLTAMLSFISKGHSFAIRADNLTYVEDFVSPDCYSYSNIDDSWNTCIVPNAKADSNKMSVDYIYGSLKYICKEQEQVKKCMRSKFGSCNTWPTIEKMMETSSDFCINEDIPEDVKSVLTGEAAIGKTLTEKCLLSSLYKGVEEICDVSIMPRPTGYRLEDEQSDRKAIFDWYVPCFKTLSGNKQPDGECDGMTRQTVFGIAIASVPTSMGIGVDFYSGFKDFMKTGEGLDLVEQIIKQRSIFFRNLEREAEQD